MSALVLQFAAQNDLGSAIIRYFGHGAGFSHVDIVMPDGRLLGARSKAITIDRMIIPAGVQLRPPGYSNFSRTLRVELPMPQKIVENAWTLAISQLGKPYDKRAILGFAVNRDWRDPGAWFCSEYVAWILEAIGFMRKLVTPENKIDPDDLALVLSALIPWQISKT